MFLNKTIERNKKLIETATNLHKEGLILPDSYIIDLDTFMENSLKILMKAKEKNTRLFFMLKQIGRNPYIAKKLVELGYEGAVVVDFKEAIVMMNNNIPISHIGNLVQIPNGLLKRVLRYGVEYITVFSIEKLEQINHLAKELGIVQKVILKVVDSSDKIYLGQESGIEISKIKDFWACTASMKNIEIVGATSFPAFLYDQETNDIEKQPNYYTVLKAIDILRELGCKIEHINLPSATCTRCLDKHFGEDYYVGEPGHGLTGTTPIHAFMDLEEVPCMIYLSEISHNFEGKSYAYGGGHYRRSNVKHALIVGEYSHELDNVTPIDPENIDYYFGLDNPHKVGDTVIMAFRYQIFVTRSNLVILESKDGQLKIIGHYDSQGRKIDE